MKEYLKKIATSDKTKQNAIKLALLKWSGLRLLARLFGAKLRWIDSKIQQKMGRRNRNALYGVMIALFVLYHAPSVLWNVWGTNVTFVMEGRERIATQDGSDRYEVYTSEGLFINQNSLLRLKKNSSVLQANLKFGTTYECSTQGYQWILMKKYRNVIRCTEVVSNQGNVINK